MAMRKPLTELRPSQVQRPGPSQRRKVYGKRKANIFNPIFIMDPEVPSQKQRSNENTELEECMKELRIDDRQQTQPSSLKPTPSEEEHEGTQVVIIGAAKPKETRELSHNARTASSTGAQRPVLREYENMFGELRDLANGKALSDFSPLADQLTAKHSLRKIAEGSFADVYILNPLDDKKKATSILKVLPIRGKHSKSKKRTALKEVLREVKLCDLLTTFPGFTVYKGLFLAIGEYPGSFKEACEEFNQNVRKPLRKSEHKRYSNQQVFAIIELGPAGRDGERLKKPSAFAVRDIFWQLVICLMNAEVQLNFEHRDLHISNICIGRWDIDKAQDVDSKMLAEYPMNTDPCANSALISNLRPTIIDYTLSRSNLGQETKMCTWNTESQWSSFIEKIEEGNGEEETEQMNTYGRMQLCIEERAVEQEFCGPARYKLYAPKTNVVWLMYLLWILVKRGEGRVVEGNLMENQKWIWEQLGAILENFHGCDVAELPENTGAFVQVAREKGWVTEGELTRINHQLDEEADEKAS